MVAHKGQQGQPPYLGHSRKPWVIHGFFAFFEALISVLSDFKKDLDIFILAICLLLKATFQANRQTVQHRKVAGCNA